MNYCMDSLIEEDDTEETQMMYHKGQHGERAVKKERQELVQRKQRSQSKRFLRGEFSN